jgi:hypothetical protein
MGRIVASLVVATLVACGGTDDKNVEQPEPVIDPVEIAPGGGVEEVCEERCRAMSDKCSADAPPVHFDVEACIGACLDETDGVLEEARLCVEQAPDCEAAQVCRERFGD